MAGLSNTIKFLRTGLYQLDEGLGGGIPLGKFMELFGEEGSGKTTLAYEIMKPFLKLGHVFYLDFEDSIDDAYMEAVGVDRSRVRVEQPEYMEHGLDMVLEAFKKSRPKYSLIVIDSVAAMLPKKMLEGSVEDNHVGLLPRKLSQFINMAKVYAKRHGATILFINQARANIGSFGGGVITVGGHAIKHQCVVRILATAGKSTRCENGVRQRLWQRKNKVSAKAVIGQVGEYHIDRGVGIVRGYEWVDVAVQLGIVQKNGPGNYTVGEQKIRGRPKLIDILAQQPEFMKIIEEGVKQ